MILEWLAFGGSLLSVYFYGKKGILGPFSGIIVSLFFILFGLQEQIHAAVISNMIFVALHTKNLWESIMKNEKTFLKNMKKSTDVLVQACHTASKEAGWWTDQKTGTNLIDTPFCVPAKLALIHSEVSEALEGDRKKTQDSHLPHRSSLEVELADAVIRIADLAGELDLDLGGAIGEKLLYNKNRPDHKIENRQKINGKGY